MSDGAVQGTRSRLSPDLLWEIPGAILSFLWFKTVKFIIAGLYGVYLALNKKRATRWQILSAKVLQIPIGLPVLMTKGPRWNTHAIIGTVGPLPVQARLGFDLQTIQQSAQSWTVVVYRYPSFQTVTQINPFDLESSTAPLANGRVEGTQFELECDPGSYCLGVRYYECMEPVIFPEIYCDSDARVAAQETPLDTNQFYQNLSQRTNWFYLTLHYYIHPLLRLQPWLPPALVTREYLPVGNPDTRFLFDYLRRGETLTVQVDQTILAAFYVYLSLYNRASLPVQSATLDQAEMQTFAIEADGFYLIRMRPRQDPQQTFDQALIQVNVI